MENFRDLAIHASNSHQFELLTTLLIRNGEQLAPFGRFHLWDNPQYNYVQYDSTQNKWVTFTEPETGLTKMAFFVAMLPKKLSFRDIYTFPLKVMDSTRSVYDSEGVFVFHVFEGVDINSLLDVINKEAEPKNKRQQFKYEQGKVIMSEGNDIKDTLLIGGLKYLTGTGGLNIGVEQAVQVQDEMGNYLVEILNNKNNGI